MVNFLLEHRSLWLLLNTYVIALWQTTSSIGDSLSYYKIIIKKHEANEFKWAEVCQQMWRWFEFLINIMLYFEIMIFYSINKIIQTFTIKSSSKVHVDPKPEKNAHIITETVKK